MKTLRVLTVDDSRTILAMLHHTLSNAGFEVLQAEDGKQGLDVLKTEQVDVVITDINMPIMDGLKLVRRIRADAAHKDVPIVIVTTESAEEDRKRAMALGANAYVTKPIQAPRILEVVRELLKLES